MVQARRLERVGIAATKRKLSGVLLLATVPGAG